MKKFLKSRAMYYVLTALIWEKCSLILTSYLILKYMEYSQKEIKTRNTIYLIYTISVNLCIRKTTMMI